MLQQYAWVPTAAKVAWPILLIAGMLWRTAPADTKDAVKQVAANAAGVQLPPDKPDQVSAASAKLVVTPASSTWVSRAAGGSK